MFTYTFTFTYTCVKYISLLSFKKKGYFFNLKKSRRVRLHGFRVSLHISMSSICSFRESLHNFRVSPYGSRSKPQWLQGEPPWFKGELLQIYDESTSVQVSKAAECAFLLISPW
jgi:hypothetical protein